MKRKSKSSSKIGWFMWMFEEKGTTSQSWKFKSKSIQSRWYCEFQFCNKGVIGTKSTNTKKVSAISNSNSNENMSVTRIFINREKIESEWVELYNNFMIQFIFIQLLSIYRWPKIQRSKIGGELLMSFNILDYT